MHDTDYWINQYKEKGALWIHDGNPKRPHAKLTSNRHSNGFFNSRLVIPDEVLLRDSVCYLTYLFSQQDVDIKKIDGIVGPQTGATKLAEFISDQINVYNRDPCFWASPAKHSKGVTKSMVFDDKDLDLFQEHHILLCEDVITTDESVDLTATAVTNLGGIVLPFVVVLVNRSGLKEMSGRKIIALIDHPMPVWTLEECLLCKQGSEAIRPKGIENWSRLNAIY